MNILILTDRYYPAPMSGAILTRDLALELAAEGHQVFLACGDSALHQEFSFKKEGNICVLRVKNPDQRDLNLPMRLLHETRLQKKIWAAFLKVLINQDLDLAIVHSPTIFWHFILKQLNKRNDLKTYLILRDLFPQWLVDTKSISVFNPVYWYMKLRELQLYNQVNVIGVQNKNNLSYFKTKKYFRRYKVKILYNWKIIGDKGNLESDIRNQLKLENKVLFIFGGNLGFGQDIENLLRLISSIQNEESFHFLFIGDGTQYEKIKGWINRNEMQHCVSLLPAVSNEEYQAILNECDVGVISLRKDFKTDNFPNKLLNYLEYQLPILASINPDNDLFRLIEKKKIGLVCKNGNDNEFIELARNLIANQIDREKMGDNGYKLLKEIFDVKVAIKQILNL